jgi:hypothetical protein
MSLTDVGPEPDVTGDQERAWAMAFSPPKGSLLQEASEKDAEGVTTRLRVQQFAEVSV